MRILWKIGIVSVIKAKIKDKQRALWVLERLLLNSLFPLTQKLSSSMTVTYVKSSTQMLYFKQIHINQYNFLDSLALV